MKATIIAIALILATTVAPADQQAWVSRADADRAAVLLTPGSTLRLYCLPCGDESWTEAEVERVEVVHTGSGEYWEVLVNGGGIDLAYSYVGQDGRWENLAMLLGLEATGVPRLLGSSSADPAAELAAAEVELEHLAAALAGSVPGAGRQVERAEKAWRRYVEAQVAAELAITRSPDGGTATRLRLTRARIAEVEALLALDP